MVTLWDHGGYLYLNDACSAIPEGKNCLSHTSSLLNREYIEEVEANIDNERRELGKNI